ncbi:hypothetical protein ACFL27_23070 [candidate division CSSED10-310 bacterium]|uniref:Tetratricopeptide repeat protein n=1 Tax=candidate division CSSED10-310 bacterium TaxID=2855610 RepID=A0ABV6Z3R0_UNCC1
MKINSEISYDVLKNGFAALLQSNVQTSAENFSFCLADDNIPLPHRILISHILGLLYYRIGALFNGAKFLKLATDLEKQYQKVQISLHTTHEVSLLDHLKGDLFRTEKYYIASYNTLKKMSNKEGMSFCLKSLGELSLTNGDVVRTEKLWHESYRLFRHIDFAEKDIISDWLELLKTVS